MPTADASPARDGEGPYLGTTFRVRISGSASARRAAGLPIARVEWGPFPVMNRDSPATPAPFAAAGLPARHVLLRSAVTRTTDLADWWRAERSPKRSGTRTVVVELVDAASGEAVVTWTFRRCRAVQLSHSPLDALEASVVTESLVFEYSDVDIE